MNEVYIVTSIEYYGDEISSELNEYHKTFAGAVRKALSEKRRYSKLGYTMKRYDKSWYGSDDCGEVRATVYIIKRPLED